MTIKLRGTEGPMTADEGALLRRWGQDTLPVFGAPTSWGIRAGAGRTVEVDAFAMIHDGYLITSDQIEQHTLPENPGTSAIVYTIAVQVNLTTPAHSGVTPAGAATITHYAGTASPGREYAPIGTATVPAGSATVTNVVPVRHHQGQALASLAGKPDTAPVGTIHHSPSGMFVYGYDGAGNLDWQNVRPTPRTAESVLVSAKPTGPYQGQTNFGSAVVARMLIQTTRQSKWVVNWQVSFNRTVERIHPSVSIFASTNEPASTFFSDNVKIPGTKDDIRLTSYPYCHASGTSLIDLDPGKYYRFYLVVNEDHTLFPANRQEINIYARSTGMTAIEVI